MGGKFFDFETGKMGIGIGRNKTRQKHLVLMLTGMVLAILNRE